MRFVEVTVNGPKTWSLAAALHPEIAEAYDAAQMAAAEEIIGWLASHATTRVGPRDRQVQVPVEQIEAAVVRHFTSRAGDPHRHLHLQINARVFAAGAWRGLHTVGVRDSLEAINGIGHAAVMTNPEFRAALAARGFTLDADTGEVAELTPYAGAFSARAKQIETNIDTYEAAGARSIPARSPVRRCGRRGIAGRGPTPGRTRSSRPTGEELRERWVEELHELGFTRTRRRSPATRTARRARSTATHSSSWRSSGSAPAARRGTRPTPGVRSSELIAASGGAVDGAVRRELAEDLAARVVAASRPLLGRVGCARARPSAHVLRRPGRRARDRRPDRPRAPRPRAITVSKGAAGAGKTTRLAATREPGRGTGGGWSS